MMTSTGFVNVEVLLDNGDMLSWRHGQLPQRGDLIEDENQNRYRVDDIVWNVRTKDLDGGVSYVYPRVVIEVSEWMEPGALDYS